METATGKRVARFQFVDVGASGEGWLATGPSFQGFDMEVMGTGPTAHDAMESALNAMAADGIDTRLLHESAIEAGYSSQDARQAASELADDQDNDDDTGDVLTSHEYVVVIRFDLEEA